MYFKEAKHDDWLGTILLSGGQIMHRPSKKDGYCFKFVHPLRHAIHAQKVLGVVIFTHFPDTRMFSRAPAVRHGTI